MQQVKLWDAPVRCYHWSQAILIGVLWYSGEQQLFGLHQLAGYLLLALLGARWSWGLVGSQTARFRAMWQVHREHQPMIGHSIAASAMMLLLWGLLAAQIVTGLMSSDDLSFDGPLIGVVPESWLSFAGWWHGLGFNLLLGAVTVHVVAACYHQWRGDPVIRGMITGRKPMPSAIPVRFVASRWFWLILLGYLLLLGYWQGANVWDGLHSDFSW